MPSPEQSYRSTHVPELVMPVRPVRLEEYNPRWPHYFQEEAERIQDSLGGIYPFEHVGSTAIAGMPAKPIIDMMLTAPTLTEADRLLPQLAELGYAHYPSPRNYHERRFLRREANPSDDLEGYHLHIVTPESSWREQLIKKRDRLRTDPHAAQAYAAKKREAAELFPDHHGEYSRYKAQVLQEL